MRLFDFLTWLAMAVACYLVLIFSACFIGWHRPYWSLADWHIFARLLFFLWLVCSGYIAAQPESNQRNGRGRG